MALNASNVKALRPRTAPARSKLGLFSGGSMVGIVAVSLQRHSLRAGSVSAAPASLARMVGASRMGAQTRSAVMTRFGAKLAFLSAWFAQAGAMPPCSLHHRRASATASHNKSVNTDAQGRPAALPRLSLVAGYVRR